ncbi:MAG TPA: histidine phosphatase family protein, partial [Coleofasciculaceae cyanobacterium]
ETICQQLDPQPSLTTSELLREVDLPLWEGMPVSDVKAKFPEAYDRWKHQPHQFSMDLPSGEHFPVLALHAQAKEFWQGLLSRHAGQTIALVGHNGINRCLISTALGITPDRYHCLLQSNCAISVLNFAGGLEDSVQLESMNLTAHLGALGVPAVPQPGGGDRGPQLLLVRHGETEWNRQGRFQGQIDVPLNETGHAQASKVGTFLKDVAIDLAFSSPMARPKATAEAILAHHPGLELGLLDTLKEIGHGLWEGKYEAEIEAEYPGLLKQWQTHPETVQMPEGENLQQVFDRAAQAWAAVLAHTGPVTPAGDRPLTGLVVAHDAVNKALLCQLTGLGPDSIWRFKQGNGGVTAICYPNGPDSLPVLQAMNITHHLSGTILDKTAAGAL